MSILGHIAQHSLYSVDRDAPTVDVHRVSLIYCIFKKDGYRTVVSLFIIHFIEPYSEILVIDVIWSHARILNLYKC